MEIIVTQTDPLVRIEINNYPVAGQDQVYSLEENPSFSIDDDADYLVMKDEEGSTMFGLSQSDVSRVSVNGSGGFTTVEQVRDAIIALLPDSGGGGGDVTDAELVPQTVKHTLTAAEIRGSATTPVLVSGIPAPGAGKMIVVLGVQARFNWNSVQFDATSVLTVVSDNYKMSPGANGIAFAFENINSFTSDKIGTGFLYGMPENLEENEQIYIAGDADSTVGNSTVDVYITYKIITL